MHGTNYNMAENEQRIFKTIIQRMDTDLWLPDQFEAEDQSCLASHTIGLPVVAWFHFNV